MREFEKLWCCKTYYANFCFTEIFHSVWFGEKITFSFIPKVGTDEVLVKGTSGIASYELMEGNYPGRSIFLRLNFLL